MWANAEPATSATSEIFPSPSDLKLPRHSAVVSAEPLCRSSHLLQSVLRIELRIVFPCNCKTVLWLVSFE